MSRFKAVLSEEVGCAGASGAATAARHLALLVPAPTKLPVSRPTYCLHRVQRDVEPVLSILHVTKTAHNTLYCPSRLCKCLHTFVKAALH